MPVGELPHAHELFAPERPADRELVSHPHPPIRFHRLAVGRHFAASAGFLRFRPRLEQARDVEPDVETYAILRIIAVDHSRTTFYSSLRQRSVHRRDCRANARAATVKQATL